MKDVSLRLARGAVRCDGLLAYLGVADRGKLRLPDATGVPDWGWFTILAAIASVMFWLVEARFTSVTSAGQKKNSDDDHHRPNCLLAPPLFWRLRLSVRARAVCAAWTCAVTQSMPPAIASALAFSHVACRTHCLWTTIGADAAVLFVTRGLTNSAFLLGSRRAAVAFAVAAPFRSILGEQGEGCTAYHQSRDDQSGESFVFHDCSFVWLFFVSTVGRIHCVLFNRTDHSWLNATPMRALQFFNLGMGQDEGIESSNDQRGWRGWWRTTRRRAGIEVARPGLRQDSALKHPRIEIETVAFRHAHGFHSSLSATLSGCRRSEIRPDQAGIRRNYGLRQPNRRRWHA